MSTPREGVNPLRPYYVPPTIGEHPDPTPATPQPPVSSASPYSSGNGTASASAAGGRYASKARDMFPDLDDWNNMSGQSTSMMRTIKEVVDELLWKYTSVLLAQPFEVAKTILQVRLQDDVGALGATADVARPKLPSARSSTYDQVGRLTTIET
jgi:mitochondrial fusion and transport protein UGO1